MLRSERDLLRGREGVEAESRSARGVGQQFAHYNRFSPDSGTQHTIPFMCNVMYTTPCVCTEARCLKRALREAHWLPTARFPNLPSVPQSVGGV